MGLPRGLTTLALHVVLLFLAVASVVNAEEQKKETPFNYVTAVSIQSSASGLLLYLLVLYISLLWCFLHGVELFEGQPSLLLNPSLLQATEEEASLNSSCCRWWRANRVDLGGVMG
ncbi:hypothetical protein cyc_00291 [Cyclospora cayetanensis]|uniref:Transmembrane protein n=1 Tax=Cyclospora cayetanensis TaxID=88456 RepID=A0A1D3D0D3_9EIME|nr:hypothetical protein cyc_00291 [Cyclospora cayetanensis]